MDLRAHLAGATSGPAARRAPAARSHPLLELQRLTGNRAVRGLLAGASAPAVVTIQRRKGDATDAVLHHIFRGEPGESGEVAGYHSEHEAADAIAEVPADAARTTGGDGGVYTAKPVNPKPGKKGKGGKALKAKAAGSSFFPSTLDRAAVKTLIEGSQVTSDARFNRIGELGRGADAVSVPMKLAGATLYPVFVAEAAEDSGKGKKGKK